MSDEDEKEIHALMSEAELIVFLGFAYHDQNLALLKPVIPLGHKRMLGTAKGMSDRDVRVVRAQLYEFYSTDARNGAASIEDLIEIRNDLTCSELFSAYSKSLAS